MYLEKAKKLLEEEYKQRRNENKSGFLIEVMDEKITHSYQVLGAGKYLLKHEACFAKCSDEEKDFLQAVVLLHDIARFYEFLALGQGVKIDHGVYGAEMLTKIPEFNRVEATLPIKHHGHLIESLYDDEEYKALPAKLKKKVEKIAFLIRDADKLANFYLLISKFNKMAPLFFVERIFEEPHKKKISAEARADFVAYKTVRMKYITNFAERALGFFSWIFDLNYRYSFIFMQKTRIVKRLSDCFSVYCYKKDMKCFTKQIEEYVARKI